MQRDRDNHDNRDLNRKNPDPISQLLMWLLPALLLGVLAYYLYQRYYGAPKVEVPAVTTAAPEVAAPVSAPAEAPAAAPEAAKAGYAQA